MISDPQLPSKLIPGCMDVLLKLSSHEQDFMRVVVEIVQNVREDTSKVDGDDNDDDVNDAEETEAELDLDSATPEDIAQDQRRRREKSAKKIQNQQLDPDVYLRCLALVRALLERVAGVSRTLQQTMS